MLQPACIKLLCYTCIFTVLPSTLSFNGSLSSAFISEFLLMLLLTQSGVLTSLTMDYHTTPPPITNLDCAPRPSKSTCFIFTVFGSSYHTPQIYNFRSVLGQVIISPGCATPLPKSTCFGLFSFFFLREDNSTPMSESAAGTGGMAGMGVVRMIKPNPTITLFTSWKTLVEIIVRIVLMVCFCSKLHAFITLRGKHCFLSLS